RSFPTPRSSDLPQVRLEFDLAAESTQVRSELRFEPAPGTAPGTPLVLQGEDLELVEVRLDGRPLAADEYQLTDDTLSLVPPGHGKPFSIGIVSLCHPRSEEHTSELQSRENLVCR